MTYFSQYCSLISLKTSLNLWFSDAFRRDRRKTLWRIGLKWSAENVKKASHQRKRLICWFQTKQSDPLQFLQKKQATLLEAFSKPCQTSKMKYFCKILHLRYLTGFWTPPHCSVEHLLGLLLADFLLKKHTEREVLRYVF